MEISVKSYDSVRQSWAMEGTMTMHTGMLWFDNDPALNLTVKIQKAVDYYHRKYGRTPDLCLVHPGMLANGKQLEIGKLTIRPYRPILPGHLWLGVEEKS